MSDESKPSPEIATDKPPKTESVKADSNPENPPSPSPLTPAAERQCQSETKEHWNDLTCWGKFERVAKTVEFAGIIGALIFICVQWSDINTTSQDVGQAINLISNQVVFAQSQSKTLQTQANTMQGQLDEMKLDERAWVFVTIPNNAFNPSTNNGVITLTEKNGGKTPALITSEYGNGTENPSEIQFHDPIGTKDSLVLIPNGEATLTITIPLNVEARMLVGNRVYFYGTIYYSDISGNKHWSQFCFSFQNNGIIMHTENFHNSCDDLEANQINQKPN
jgi:hypothetical protein